MNWVDGNHSNQDNNTSVFMVIGAIGKVIARQLAELEGSEAVLVCRDKYKAEQAVNEIIDITNNPKVRFELADLGRHKDTKESVGYALPAKLARQ